MDFSCPKVQSRHSDGKHRDPRYFESGKVVLQLSLAVRRKYHQHPLERRALYIMEDETDRFNLELWSRGNDFASKYVRKGARVGEAEP